MHLVTVVTSGQVTKVAITPFDPPYSKTHGIQANLIALSFIEPDLREMEVLHVHCGNIGVFDFCTCDLDLEARPDDLHTNLTRTPWR